MKTLYNIRIKDRIAYLFVHILLAIIHFIYPSEGDKFFEDECRGGSVRLKRDKIKKLFPHMNKWADKLQYFIAISII